MSSTPARIIAPSRVRLRADDQLIAETTPEGLLIRPPFGCECGLPMRPVTHNETDEQLPHTVDVTWSSVELLARQSTCCDLVGAQACRVIIDLRRDHQFVGAGAIDETAQRRLYNRRRANGRARQHIVE
jgi:hypothetical protein